MSQRTADESSRMVAASSSRGGDGSVRRRAVGVFLCSAWLAAGCLHLPRPQAKSTHTAAGDTMGVDEARAHLPLALASAEDYVVRVVAGNVTCSGSLIAEDRVLTAHHCISQRGHSGRILELDVAPEGVKVELGGDPFAWGEVAVRAIIAPTCGYSGGEGDIAILVLERRLTGVSTREVGLGDPPQIGTPIEPIGFGRCLWDRTAGARTIRTGGPIQDVWKRDFRVEASICPGDSGGPAVAAGSGEILGVISQAVMDASPDTRDRAEFTRVDAWRSLFTHAQAVVDGMSPLELPPVDCR